MVGELSCHDPSEPPGSGEYVKSPAQRVSVCIHSLASALPEYLESSMPPIVSSALPTDFGVRYMPNNAVGCTLWVRHEVCVITCLLTRIALINKASEESGCL